MSAIDLDMIEGYFGEAQLFKVRINRPIYTLHTLDRSSAYRVIKEWCEANGVHATRTQVSNTINYFSRAILGQGAQHHLVTTVTMLRLCYSAVLDFIVAAENAYKRASKTDIDQLGMLYSLANANLRLLDQIDLEINQYLHLCFKSRS